MNTIKKGFINNKYQTITALIIILSATMSSTAQRSMHMGMSATPTYSILRSENAELAEDKNAFTWNVNLDLYIDMSPRLQIVTGIGYYQIAINRRDYSVRYGSDHDGSGGWIPYNSWKQDSCSLGYIGVPVIAKLKLQGNKNHIYATAGLTFLYHVTSGDSESIIYESGIPDPNSTDLFFKDDFVSDFLIMPVLGLGYEFQLSQRKLFIEPQLSFTLNEALSEFTTDDFTNNVTFINIGLKAGIRF